MKHASSTLRFALPALCILSGPVFGQLTNYWPVSESSGTTTVNAAGGVNGLLSGAGLVTDGTRGQVLEFSGAGSYVNAGFLPALSTASNYTWSFWVNSNEGTSNNVIVGNRYSSTFGVDFSPREFTKFTTGNFEWHVNAGSQNVNYTDLVPGTWAHQAVVKTGPLFVSYRDGVVNGMNVVNAGLNNAQPLYFGGDQGGESWSGRLDDIATWSGALPSSSVIGMARGAYTPAGAPVTAGAVSLPTLAMDHFDSLAAWTPTGRGLENNGAAGYNAPVITAGGVSLSGTAGSQYWFGNSIESVASYDATRATEVSVDRVSLSGSGTAYRSSLWILGDDAHYLHFSQNMNEGGWSWNARDDGGSGTLNPTGTGNNLALLDGLDGDVLSHNMKITLEPVGSPGDVNMYLYLDGSLVGAQGFTNFPDNFKVVLTGQDRAAGDTVDAVFDNFVVKQVPEPSVTLSLALGGLFLLRRRR